MAKSVRTLTLSLSRSPSWPAISSSSRAATSSCPAIWLAWANAGQREQVAMLLAIHVGLRQHGNRSFPGTRPDCPGWPVASARPASRLFPGTCWPARWPPPGRRRPPPAPVRTASPPCRNRACAGTCRAASSRCSAVIGEASPMRDSAKARPTCSRASSHLPSRCITRAIARRAWTRSESGASSARPKRSMAASRSPSANSASPVASSTSLWS